ncbi:hypothetical protein BC940DRAFT_234491, partial [Gongronella butleri]
VVFSLKISVTQVIGSFGSNGGWMHLSSKEQIAMLYAQNFMLVSFVWCLAWMSATFLYRTNSIISYSPFKNKIWIGAFIAVIVLQLAFCAVSLATIKDNPVSLHDVPWYIYFIGLIWPVVLVPVQELVKLHDDKEFTRFQKRSKLEFSTKLGMHSPL